MFRTLCSAALLSLTFLPFAATAVSASHGGDVVLFQFQRGKDQAIGLLKSMNANAYERISNPTVRATLAKYQQDLIRELAISPIQWSEEALGFCAQTDLTLGATITLSRPVCARSVDNSGMAGRILVHEALHHFGIRDETLATNVAEALYDSLAGQIEPGADYAYDCRMTRFKNGLFDGESRNFFLLSSESDMTLVLDNVKVIIGSTDKYPGIRGLAIWTFIGDQDQRIGGTAMVYEPVRTLMAYGFQLGNPTYHYDTTCTRTDSEDPRHEHR